MTAPDWPRANSPTTQKGLTSFHLLVKLASTHQEMRREAGREAWHLKGSQMNAAREVKGSVVFPLTQQIRNTIDTHGAEWAFLYYAARMPAAELVFFWNVAISA